MSIKHIYWDANCFLALLKAEQDRIEAVSAIIKNAEKGKIKIVTSVLTLTEVLKIKGEKLVPKDKRESIKRYFYHVATALEAKIDELNIFDESLVKKSGQVGGEPLLEIKLPQKSPQGILFV